MAGVTYKRLFEVQVLHDYYLTANSTSFFSTTLTPEDRQERISDKLIRGFFNIRKDIVFEPTESSRLLLQNYRIRLAPTPLGFLVATEVREETVGGNTLYKPVIPFDEKLRLTFQMRLKNRLFKNFSNGKLKPRNPAIYYFNNLNPDSDKAPTSLSQTVAAFDTNKTYELGGLADFGGTLREALTENSEDIAANWRDVEGLGFVNERDRMLLPKQFQFDLSNFSNVTEVEIILNNLDGDEIKKMEISNPVPYKKIKLDFSKNDVGDDIENGFYEIQLNGNDGFTFQKIIHLDDDLFDNGLLGIIDVHAFTDDTNYQLLDDDGFLAHTPAGVTQYPIFELRFRNRITYWRYKSKEPFAGAAPTYLEFESGSANKILVSILPKAIAQSTTEFNIVPPTPVDKKLYPNPRPTPLKYEPDGRIYSDININAINRLEN